MLLLGRKVITNLDSILKSRDITLPTKVRLVSSVQFFCSVMSDSSRPHPSSQSYGFSSSRAVHGNQGRSVPCLCVDTCSATRGGNLAPAEWDLETWVPIKHRRLFVILLIFFNDIWYASSHVVLQVGIEPISPALEARSLNHWTAREVQTKETLKVQNCQG